MRRIKLNVRDFSSKKPSRSEVTALLKSDRNYQNMSVHLTRATNLKRKMMLLPKFSSSLVELELHRFFWMEMDLPSNMSFPKLESLRAETISVSVAMELVKGASKLQTLSIDFFRLNQSNEEFAEMLLKKKTLKKLAMRNVPRDFFSFDSFSTPEFKLTSLVFESYNFDPYICRHNFKAFVLAMADTLTSLDIYYLEDEDALLIQNLPALKILKAGR
jgi:hypothetical protein